MVKAYRVLLVNLTDGDVHIPLPMVNCDDGYGGAVGIVRNFTPLKGRVAEPVVRSGCASDRGGPWPEILERIQESEWRVLHAGESLALGEGCEWEIVGPRANPIRPGRVAFDERDEPGTYEIQARYTPPPISASDREILRKAGLVLCSRS